MNVEQARAVFSSRCVRKGWRVTLAEGMLVRCEKQDDTIGAAMLAGSYSTTPVHELQYTLLQQAGGVLVTGHHLFKYQTIQGQAVADAWNNNRSRNDFQRVFGEEGC